MRQGLQRLDDRRVVRHRAGPVHPARHHPAVGPAARPSKEIERTAAKGAHSFCVLGEPRAARAARRSTTRSATGTRCCAAANDNEHGACRSTSARRRRCRRSRPTLAASWPTSPWARSAPPAPCSTWIFSGMLQNASRTSRSPCPRATIGWIPYFLERAEQVLRRAAPLGGQGPGRSAATASRVPHARPGSSTSTRIDVYARLPRARLRLLHRRRHRPRACSTSSARTT